MRKKTALRAALAHIERLHPGWHCWISDKGRLWAVSTQITRPGYFASGTTVDGGTPAELEAAISKEDGIALSWQRLIA